MSSLGNKEIMAKNIKRYMDLKKKTRNDIVNDLKIAYTTFVSWETGEAYPRIDKIELLANYFGIQKSDLVEEEGFRTPSDKDPSDKMGHLFRLAENLDDSGQEKVARAVEGIIADYLRKNFQNQK